MKKLSVLLLVIFCTTIYKSQNVNIPDANFKAYLLGNTAINTNRDSQISVAEATAFTGVINCQNRTISDLTGIEAFVKITGILCNNNNLISLDVSKNTALIVLSCNSNQLTTLDVSKNTALQNLQFSNNQLTTLDISKNTALSVLQCGGNSLGSIDVTKNTALIFLSCENNQLTSLDVSKNTALTDLYCFNNQLTTLDVSKNTALQSLYCFDNQLTTLDVSKNTALTNLYCHVNPLTSLNLKNGNNTALTYMWAQNNPNLTCIQVDNVANANAKPSWQKDATASYRTDCSPIVYIPDANFKAYLVGNSAINLDGDNEIQVSEATAFTGTINCNTRNIASLTGIEAFTKITNLYCYGNQLTALDVSKNTLLQDLRCDTNQITSLDVSKNIALTRLQCGTNKLTVLDLSKNTALKILSVSSNKLTVLDVSKNTALTDLICTTNLLITLDVSKNLVLSKFYCNENQITGLDLSKNTSLTDLRLQINKLESLNLKNGTNTIITAFNAKANTSLTCILVDNPTYSVTAGGWLKDGTATYRIDCSPIVYIPDANFKAYLVGNSAINLDGDNEIQVSEATAFTGTINCNTRNIASLTGIEAFINLKELQCYGNQLTTLDVTKNTALTKLECYSNLLPSLDVTKNTLLKEFLCTNNKLTALDVSENIALTKFYCNDNQITSLDLSKNGLLKELRLQNNKLTNLNVKNGNNNPTLKYFNAKGNTSLLCIQVDNPTYSQSAAEWQKDNGASYSEDCSATLSTTNINKKEITLYPNPVKNVLYFSEELSDVKITDILGKSVKQIFAKGKFVDVANLANGIYIITAVTKTGKIVNEKIVKE